MALRAAMAKKRARLDSKKAKERNMTRARSIVTVGVCHSPRAQVALSRKVATASSRFRARLSTAPTIVEDHLRLRGPSLGRPRAGVHRRAGPHVAGERDGSQQHQHRQPDAGRATERVPGRALRQSARERRLQRDAHRPGHHAHGRALHQQLCGQPVRVRLLRHGQRYAPGHHAGRRLRLLELSRTCPVHDGSRLRDRAALPAGRRPPSPRPFARRARRCPSGRR